MARSTVGKIKLDIERLERREVKLLRRLDNLKRAVAQNRYVLDMLKKALVAKLEKEQADILAAAGVAVNLGKEN